MTNYLIHIHVFTGNWSHWSRIVPSYEYPTDSVPLFSSILVPNIDNIRTTFLINLIAQQNMVNLYTYIYCI